MANPIIVPIPLREQRRGRYGCFNCSDYKVSGKFKVISELGTFYSCSACRISLRLKVKGWQDTRQNRRARLRSELGLHAT